MAGKTKHHKRAREKGILSLDSMANDEKAMLAIIAVLAVAIVILAVPYLKNIKLSSGEKTYSAVAFEIGGCDECFDLGLVSAGLDSINNLNIKETTALNYTSADAEKLIKKYGITKIPALVIVSRSIGKIEMDDTLFRKTSDAAIFDKAAPYIDLGSLEVKGLADFKEIYDSKCKECASMSKLRAQLERSGVKIKSYEMVEASSEDGKKLISENGITFVPALLISKNIMEYWWIFSAVQKSLAENKDYYMFTEPYFPYKELSTGVVKGKVKITYITNKSCTDCYNITQLKPLLQQQLGIYIASERYDDVSSSNGQSLVKTYNITEIPTIILSKEISDYTSIKTILEQVGSFKNNEFVFRKMEVLNGKFQSVGQAAE